MGGSASVLIKNEQKTWVEHKLDLEPTLRAEQLPLISKFGPVLKIAHRAGEYCGLSYTHYLVTDDNWVIEFGGGDLSAASVNVHSNPIKDYIIEAKFDKTDAVIQRMQKICGARSYSLCLRNCEHLARYIYCGSWTSHQTVGSGNIAKQFFDYMLGENKALMNQLPYPLEEEKSMQKVLRNLPSAPPLKYLATICTVPKEKDAFNILFLGPTGVGKSRLINLLVDLDVCMSRDSADSVTSQVKVIKTQGFIGKQRRTINLIDTVGLCDTKISTSQVLAIIKQFCKSQELDIHSVVIVVKSRLEDSHVEGIQQFLTWLKYKQQHNCARFSFIFNRMDDADGVLKTENLNIMIQKLGLETDQQNVNSATKEQIQKKIAIGFPSQGGLCDYNLVKDNYQLLQTAILDNPIDFPPLDAKESWCSIL